MYLGLNHGCAERRRMCQQEVDVPRGDESPQCKDKLGVRYADRGWMCRREMRTFRVQMNWELDVSSLSTLHGRVDKRWMC